MRTISPTKDEELAPRSQLPANQMMPDAQTHDDFALVQLDTTFVTLLSELSTLGPPPNGRHGFRAAENVCSTQASEIQKIESVLARLEPVERAIMTTPARTIVGLGIKARHAAYVVAEHWDIPIEQVDWDARAVRLLIEAISEVAGMPLLFSGEASR